VCVCVCVCVCGGAEQLVGGTGAREHLQEAATQHACLRTHSHTHKHTHTQTHTAPYTHRTTHMPLGTAPENTEPHSGEHTRGPRRALPSPLPPYQWDCHHSNPGLVMSPRFGETGDGERVRDRQAIKRAKDKDGERGALNTLHSARLER